jgi:hypothetical protein
MSKKQFKIKPKVWPKEYTFEEFKRLNPNINENLLVNYYNKYLQEYAENRSRFIEYFEDNKKLLVNNLQEAKNRYDQSQYFLRMYYYNQPDAVGGDYPPFKPTDIDGLTHWFKAEPQFIESQDVIYNATTNIQEIVSWSNAANSNSHLIKNSNELSGFFVNNSVGFFRGRNYLNGNTGGQLMKLTDTPRFGAFTYFGVFEFNGGEAAITPKSGEVFTTESILYERGPIDLNADDRSIQIAHGTRVEENFRIVFAKRLDETVYGNFFNEQPVTASIENFMSDAELLEGKISSSTLSTALVSAINTIPFFTASQQTGTKVVFIKHPEISSYTGLPHDGNFHNAVGEAQTIVVESHFTGSNIIQLAETSNRFHGLWAGQTPSGGQSVIDNNMLIFGKPIGVDDSMDIKFSFAASSSIDTGDDTGAVEQISNDPKNNRKVVLMVTKDAPENAVLKVYVNNVSVFPEGSEAAGNLELDDLAHFEPKFFGRHSGQGRTLNGKVYEMGFYTGSLEGLDRKQLYYYLALKHGTPGYNGPSKLRPYNWPDDNYYL